MTKQHGPEPTKDHWRVSPKGKAMGRNAVRFAKLGRIRLASLGLDGLDAPMLRKEMCKSCACKANTVPNGCLQTQMDFLKSVVDGRPFRCHAPNDGRMCAGWVQARAEIVANPLPQGAMDLLAKWEYSPPDEDAA